MGEPARRPVMEYRAAGVVNPDLRDQAEGLRRHAARLGRRAQVLAVASGKGGVGKTNIAVNLAVSAAALGRRAVVLDADLGLANAAELLDLSPRWNVSHVLAGQVDAVQALVPGPEGVELLPGASGLTRLADLGPADRERLVGSLDGLETRADLIVVDTGAGIGANVVRMATAATRVLVVTTPEPTAIKDAYALIKVLAREPGRPPVDLVINMAENALDAARAMEAVTRVAREFLRVDVGRMGYILHDRSVSLAVRRRRPFVLEFPRSTAACGLRSLARAVLDIPETVRTERAEGFFRRLSRVFQ